MKKCEYCDGEFGNCPRNFILRELLNFGELGDIALSLVLFDDKWLSCTLGNTEKVVKIKYCPMCGRKLEPEKLREDAQLMEEANYD